MAANGHESKSGREATRLPQALNVGYGAGLARIEKNGLAQPRKQG